MVVHCTPSLNLKATLDCGQAFRWQPCENGYAGIVEGVYVQVFPSEEGFILKGCDEEAFERIFVPYFDLSFDYSAAAARLQQDAVFAPMVSACVGMRLLRQPIWECLISFLISSNNNVKRIQKTIENVCAAYGREVYNGRYSFPDPITLSRATEEELRACGTGYRAPYLLSAAKRVAEGYDLSRLPTLGYTEAKKELMSFLGVGAKVADCVLLFSCGYRSAFPVDVWVARSMKAYYPQLGEDREAIGRYARETFGEDAGLAQQYLFYVERNRKNPQ